LRARQNEGNARPDASGTLLTERISLRMQTSASMGTPTKTGIFSGNSKETGDAQASFERFSRTGTSERNEGVLLLPEDSLGGKQGIRGWRSGLSWNLAGTQI